MVRTGTLHSPQLHARCARKTPLVHLPHPCRHRAKIDALALCVCALLVQAGGTLGAQDITFSGSAQTALGVYVRGSNAGNFSRAQETVAGELDVRFANCEAFIAGNVFFNALAAFSDGTFSFADGLGAELKEAYFSWTSPEFGRGLTAGIKIGRQINAWGKADAIRIADVLCPQNLTTLNGANYSESRLGIDAIKITLSGMIFSLDAYWMPFFRPSALPLQKWNALGALLIPKRVSVPGVPDPVPIALGAISRPELKLANGSYAARASFWLSRIDFSLYGYYGFDDFPIVDYALDALPPTTITVSGDYHRYGMAGFDMALPVSTLVFRLESAFLINRAFQTDAAHIFAGGTSYERKHEVRGLFGIDWMQSGWTVTAQYYGDGVFGDAATLSRSAYEHGTTLSVSRSFFSETLTLSLTGALRWNDFDSFVSAKVQYALTDAIALLLAFDGYFPGKNDGEYGKYKDLSCVRLEGIFRF